MLIFYSILLLGVIGLIAALLLYIAAKKFAVYEDPVIGEIEELLPGANCGGCGETGCHAFAVACAKADTLDGLVCPSSGQAIMNRIAAIKGVVATDVIPNVAVLHCNGSCENRPHINKYDGTRSCAIESLAYSGETDCQYGCLGCGDCVATCPYDSIHMDEETGLPIVDMTKCVGCGRCVKACPRGLLSLVPKVPGKTLVWVACKNRDKGAVAMKACAVACIGCTKCKKVCPSEAVTIESFLSSIDPAKCTGCETCVAECPKQTIHSYKQ